MIGAAAYIECSSKTQQVHTHTQHGLVGNTSTNAATFIYEPLNLLDQMASYFIEFIDPYTKEQVVSASSCCKGDQRRGKQREPSTHHLCSHVLQKGSQNPVVPVRNYIRTYLIGQARGRSHYLSSNDVPVEDAVAARLQVSMDGIRAVCSSSVRPIGILTVLIFLADAPLNHWLAVTQSRAQGR